MHKITARLNLHLDKDLDDQVAVLVLCFSRELKSFFG